MAGSEDNNPVDVAQAFKELGEVAAPILAIEADPEKLAALSDEELAEHEAQLKRLKESTAVLSGISHEQDLQAQFRNLEQAAIDMGFIPGAMTHDIG